MTNLKLTYANLYLNYTLKTYKILLWLAKQQSNVFNPLRTPILNLDKHTCSTPMHKNVDILDLN